MVAKTVAFPFRQQEKSVQKFSLIFLLLLGAVLLDGCQNAPPKPFRLGLLVWPPYEVFYLAQDLGYYEKSPIEIVDYRTPSEALRAYRNGLLDAVALTNHIFLSMFEKDKEQRVVLVINISAGADAVVAKKQFPSIASLKGRKVGAEASALGAYVLLRALEQEGLALSDIEFVPVDVANQQNTFEKGEIDALATYEPIRTKLLQEGAVELFNSREIPGEIADVLIVREQDVTGRAAALKTLLDGWFMAMDYLNENPLAAARRICGREKVTPEEYLGSLQGIKIVTHEENVQAFLGPESEFRDATLRVAAIMKRLNILEGVPEGEKFLDGTYFSKQVR